ncbi:hypothetical protein FB567DRAFT_589176 [Paraphoma chrysanthemicola]|uniref:Uncharacterized protein n=1 Tax=Paraphoma chrysanthemicola TaxID=798071 RepID=A0A8K0W1T2_9PLEO|nr:hypothetical protein FB567DRAFT_589176 [Paraphoma chrysanthemicola]
MAPRRGGGGSSSGGGVSSTCPGAFSETVEQVGFAADVLFLVIYLGLAITLCTFRKKTGAGKKLLGAPFIIAVLFYLIANALAMIRAILQQCGTIAYYDWYKWSIATNVFSYLAGWLLLFVVVFTLNSMLQNQKDGLIKTPVKIILLAIMMVMGLLTCAAIGLQSYVNYSQSDLGSYSTNYALLYATVKLRTAYDALYMISVLAAGALALITILALRKRRSPAGDLIGWSIALTFVMVFWSIVVLVWDAAALNNTFWEWETSAALVYLTSFAQVLAFIFIMCIAKHASWSSPAGAHHAMNADAYIGADAPKYEHNAGVNQAYYYQQAPVYTGAGNPMTQPMR